MRALIVLAVLSWGGSTWAAEPSMVPCVDDADCRGGGRTGVCYPDDSGKLYCAEATLTEVACEDDAGCGEGQQCADDGAGGLLCVDVGAFEVASLCHFDANCDEGMTCDPSGVCVQGARSAVYHCTSDADCKDGGVCVVGGTCKDVGGCQAAGGEPAGVLLISMLMLVTAAILRRSLRSPLDR
jgi:hypothetical protein